MGARESPIKAWIAKDSIEYSHQYDFHLGATIDRQRKLQLIETSGLDTGIDTQNLWATMTDSDLWIHVAIPLDVVRTFNDDSAEAFTALKEHIFTVTSYEYAYSSPIKYNLTAKRFEAMSPRLVLRVLEFRHFGPYRGLTSRHADRTVRDYRSDKSGHPDLHRWIERLELRNNENAQVSNQAQLLRQANTGQASLEVLPELYPHPNTRVSLGSHSGVDAAQVRVGGQRAPVQVKEQPLMNGYQRAVDWSLPQYSGPNVWSPRDRTKAESSKITAPASAATIVDQTPVASTSKLSITAPVVRATSIPAPAALTRPDSIRAPITVVEPIPTPIAHSSPKLPKQERSNQLTISPSLTKWIPSEDMVESSPPTHRKRRRSSSPSNVGEVGSSAATMGNRAMDVDELKLSEHERDVTALLTSSAMSSRSFARSVEEGEISSRPSSISPEEVIKVSTAIKVKDEPLDLLYFEQDQRHPRYLAQQRETQRRDDIPSRRFLPPRPSESGEGEESTSDLSFSAFRSSQMPRPGQMPTATFEPPTPQEGEGDSTQMSAIQPLEIVTQVEGQPNAGQGQGRWSSFAPTHP
ncbi:BQ2448_4755 [Microbotryum intermedium]|uniref:BQ2448_4755 protein n=1 Tax=Microbotryum intermedium TaxID=269621 RepID=A0A238FIT0_9BASI|nr:BQ2448_4755 [Microbotryum intermedium]